MSRIAVVHPDLNRKGGAEAVSLNVLNSLASAHSVELLSLTQPQSSELRDYYGCSVPADEVHTGGRIGPALEYVTATVSRAAGVGNLGALDVALTNRIAKLVPGDYDLVVSTMAEMTFDTPSVQYVHYPNFRRRILNDAEGGTYAWFEQVCARLARAGNVPQESATYLANSGWTADRFAEVYDHRPTVVYPPVDTRGFDPIPWSEREEAILVAGRVGRDKRLLAILDVFESLKAEGYSGMLTIVGPAYDREYYEQVRKRAASIGDVRLLGAVSRDELVSLMSSHRYGIHGKENEHFGMVVAEFVAGGMIPFVPDSGGQTEIVDGDPTLRYDSWDALLQQLGAVVADAERQAAIRMRLPDIEAQFGVERFRNEFREIVEDRLADVS